MTKNAINKWLQAINYLSIVLARCGHAWRHAQLYYYKTADIRAGIRSNGGTRSLEVKAQYSLDP